MRILLSFFILSSTALAATLAYAEEKPIESPEGDAAEVLVMSNSNLDKTEEKLRELENAVLKQLVSGKANPVDGVASQTPAQGDGTASKVTRSIERKTKELLDPVEPPEVAETVETTSVLKASVRVSQKAESKPDSAQPAVETDSLTTLDSLRSLESHPAIRSKSSKSSDAGKASGATASSDGSSDKLLIAESQVKILSRELETTRQSLRSAERRIDELSDLVHSTYSQSESAKRADPISPEFFDGEDNDLPRADDGQRPPVVSRPSYREQPLPAAWNGASASDIATIAADHAPVRVGPNRNESTIFTLDRFYQVRVELRSGEWYRIITNSGARGWISGQALTFGNVDSDPNSSVRIRGYNSKYEPAGLQY